jgi:DNA repair protein SbcC/Rad50
VRPRRLEVEGFTSFKEKLSLDLSSLDLFAITGATGAGKSSLIDALVFALYGQVPRVSKEYRQLISHGAERVTVHLEFEVGERTYRIVRTARASGGTSQTRLESRNGKGWEPLADRSREVDEQVRQIVGLDYDAFTRSVVLPQGQFDAFLKGRPDERRKILVALLNLQVYEQMHTLANRRATEARQEAEFIARQLATEYADATAEHLEALRTDLAGAERDRECLGRRQEALREGLDLAGRVRETRRERDQGQADCLAEEERTRSAEKTLGEADAKRARLEQQRETHEAALAAIAFDADRHGVLLSAKPVADQLVAVCARRDRLAKACAEKRAAVTPKRKDAAESDAAVPALEKAAKDARREREIARGAREELVRRHAAHELRRHLKAGAACPVCEQAVKSVPRGAVPALGDADGVLRAAEKAESDAAEALRRGQVAAERARGVVEGLERELAQLDAQVDEAARDASAIEHALREAGFTAKAIGDSRGLVASIAGELRDLEDARRAREEHEKKGRLLEKERETLVAAVAAARAQVESGRERLEDLSARRDRAEAALARGCRELAAAAEREGWTVDTRAGEDEVDALERLRRELESQAGTLAETVAHLKADVRQVEARLAKTAELAEKRKKREADGALHATLAQHLRADQFLAFVQEEALRFLAEDGSRHLHRLSQGRYSLACEEQEFAVVDHWNADCRRSVRTLSGGETFLASLSLALALAESLARLSAEGRAGEALESLFLDEGFGTLDAETLDVVVDAIEALHGGERMVGIVTHIPELAERLPARLEVKRGATSATAAVL